MEIADAMELENGQAPSGYAPGRSGQSVSVDIGEHDDMDVVGRNSPAVIVGWPTSWAIGGDGGAFAARRPAPAGTRTPAPDDLDDMEIEEVASSRRRKGIKSSSGNF
jgi:hypothetical protein